MHAIDTLAEGLAHHRCGQFVAAERCYRSVLAVSPKQTNALHLYGVLLAERGDLTAASLLERVMRQMPEHTESRLALANLCQRSGDPERAALLWREILTIAPDHIGATLNLAAQLRSSGDWSSAVATCRATLAHRPESAPLWVALAACLLAGELDQPALTAANAALELAPDVAEAWMIRGTLLGRGGEMAPACAALQRALALDPANARAELHLGNLLTDLDAMEAAEPHLRRAIALAPDLVEAHASLGFLEASRQNLAAALACQNEAIRLRPDFAEAHSNRAAALLLGGDFEEGFAAYEWRKRNVGFAGGYWRSDQPEWTGESLLGRTLLVFCEQGYGDTIMCARFLPILAARGAALVLVCAPPLIGLLERLEGVVWVVPRGEALRGDLLAAGTEVPPYDTWIDQMSLPHVLGIRLETIPGAAGYLRADRRRVEQWSARLGPGLPTVGIAWAGNPAHTNDRRRSLPRSALGPLVEAADYRFVSLQIDPVPRPLDSSVQDYGSLLTDFGETAALIESLDLVISADTAVAHLAGALGRPCWLMLSYAPEWRWLLGRGDSPWYASMRLFRQHRPSDWGRVIAQIRGALGEWPRRQAPSHADAA